jgi:uncharacterized metal-binding protein YceD (DUF177 family)
MQNDLPWSHVIELAAVPDGGLDVELVADAPTRERLAEVAELVSIRELKVSLRILPMGTSGAKVQGSLKGVVRQTCVISLEEFESPIEENISVDFAVAPESKTDVEDEEEIEDVPDPIIDGKIDLGVLATEFLILGIDPYPRKPGVEFKAIIDEPGEPERKPNPFEQLSGLKTRLKKDR